MMRSALFILILFCYEVNGSCPSPPTGLSYDVDWGAPSSDPYTSITCLTITNDRPYDREEVAFSSIPLSQSLGLLEDDLDRFVVVGAHNKRVPAQMNIISRWAGIVTDSSKPIKWLQVSIPTAISASSKSTFQFRLYDTSQLRSIDSTRDIIISTSNSQHVLSTGSSTGAQFTVQESLPGLLERIQIGSDTVLSDTSSAGPSITFTPQNGGSPVTLTAADASVTYFEISETGPVKATVLVEGLFSSGGGHSLCKTNSYYATDYDSFSYSLALTFFRGKRNIKVQYHIRNQCSDADGSDWTDQFFIVDRASYSLDFSQGIAPDTFSDHYYGGPSDSSISSSGSSGPSVTTIVSQRKGGGSPWKRKAKVSRNSSTIATGNYYDAPVVAISDGNLLAGATLSHMRYREPQALQVTGSVISLDVISQRQLMGEGKGIWNHGMFFVDNAGSNAQSTLQTMRWQMLLELERGLLIHTPCQYYTNSGTMPPLGNENAADTTMKTSYMTMMELLHEDTFTQWQRAKTYGSQLWPDIQFDGYQVNSNPAQNSPYHGYWNPHAHELVEFLRSGNPKWAHDLALPLSWLTTYTAYLNIGQETHDYARSGLCINSSGSGSGQWHRSGYGSDDYMYNLALKYAYILRPDPIHRRRIEIAGRTVRGRYDRSVPEEDRDEYLERLDVARGVIQHMEAGLNCAEFARDGANLCNVWFLAVMSEFIRDNLSTGSICQDDIVVGRRCPQAQTFMQVSMMYEFFVRVYLHYGDLNDNLLRAVTGIPEGLYNHGMDKNGSGINYLGRHAYLLDCTTNSARTSLSSCVRRDVGDGYDLYWHNINSLLSTLLVAEFFKPALDFCSKVEVAWSSESSILSSWSGVVVQDAGWIKGTSQMMSFMAFGVGMLDLCNSNASPTVSPTPSPTGLPTPEPTDATIPCIDAPSQFIWLDNPRICKWAKKRSKCKRGGIQKHCPKSCSKCEDYKCSNSPLTFIRKDGTTFTCKALNALRKKKRKRMCRNNAHVRKTCRMTCGYCSK